jgi:hypothetical protein
MKTGYCISGVLLAMAAGIPAFPASLPDVPAVPAQMTITVRAERGGAPAQSLQAGDLSVTTGNNPARVVRLERLTGDLANLQLFVLLDDSTRSASLGLHLPELKTFLESLPATTQVAVGYMRNGSFVPAQAFTTDHSAAAASLRLPIGMAGGNGSPYFALGDLVKHWPSKETGVRRAVLMPTDGVDRYYGTSEIDDPYMDAAIHESLKSGVTVYSIYLRGEGLYGRGGWVRDFAQSRLIEVGQETGGNAYFETFSDPVEIAPFLKDLEDRLENQYRVTIEAKTAKGFQPVKLRMESRGIKVEGPSRIYVR